MQTVRLRRLREKDNIRQWASETQLLAKNIILPYFVVEGEGVKEPISSMPGIYHLSIDNLLKDISGAVGIKSVLLFGLGTEKDGLGSEAYNHNGVIQRAVKAIKKEFSDIVVLSDICLCGYTSHGHCGIVREGRIDNDATLDVLAKVTLSHADAGADFVSPSAMMDGQVRAIRGSLDREGFKDTGIMGYSVKYASGFYGPFREALESTPQFGDRKSYQMDYRNANEALREIAQDIAEGADIVMVKPALS
ncbi:MAG: porphobilinogen synthase, partial [bacterium]